MLGFVIGTACLIGLIKVLRGPRWHGYGHHGGWGRHGYAWGGGSCGGGSCGGGHRRHHHHHRGWGEGPFGPPPSSPFDRDDEAGPGPILLRGLFERLQTTPGQERVIAEALRELRGAFRKSAEEQAKSARQVAEAMKGDELKTENMAEAFAHLDSGVEAVRDASFTALAKIHDALDARQRKQLAELIGRGGRALENLAEQV